MPDGDDVRVGENKTGHKATSITAVNPYNESAIFKVAPEGPNVIGDIDGLVGHGAGKGAGVKATGGKRGAGVEATGGAARGPGVQATGGSDRGVGVQAKGGDHAAGVKATGGNSGAGVEAKAGFGGAGVSSIGGEFFQSSGVASTPGLGVRAEGGSTNVRPASATSQREGHAPGLLALAGRITIRPNMDPNAVDAELPPSQSVSLNDFTNVGGFGLGAAEEEILTSTSVGGDFAILGSPFPGAGLVGKGGVVRRWVDDASQPTGGHWEPGGGVGGAGVVGVSGGAAVPTPDLQEGVGGVFTADGAAQIRLLPTVQVTTPVGFVDGRAGDLLVTIHPDNFAELWFLKRSGAVDWVKIA